MLERIDSPEIPALLKELLAQPHPNGEVAKGAVEEAGRRNLRELAPDILKLCTHYRTEVREAARAVAPDVGIEALPEFVPGKAISRWLEDQLNRMGRMIRTEIPKEATWTRFTVTHPPWQEGEEPRKEVFSGWLLERGKDQYRVLDAFGRERFLDPTRTKAEPRTLATEVEVLLAIRAKGDPDEELSREGGLTGQFEVDFISAPEAMVGLWCFQRGDRKNAESILLPRFDASADDRWIGEVMRDYFGHLYHQELLDVFSHRRDYEATRRIAAHLLKPEFDEYRYQARARELAAQLEKRGDDFKSFRLPTPEEWAEKKKSLDTPGQIKFLAQRLRLLNCFQWGQPGGVSYSEDQFAEPIPALRGEERRKVINPFVELRAMKLAIGDLPTLVPFLADDSFMLAYSYWRDFHPDRTLHRANWAVADVINGPALHDLADVEAYDDSDAEGKKKHLERVTQWCRDHAAMPRTDLLFELLQTGRVWHEVEGAAAELMRAKDSRGLPGLIARMKDFPRWNDDVVKICYDLERKDAVPHAREWISDFNEAVRFWASLILLRHGDRKSGEGMPTLRAILDRDDGSLWPPRAFETLMWLGTEESLNLADDMIRKKDFFTHEEKASPILQKLIRLGRKRALDHTLAALADETELSKSKSGDETEWRTNVTGDEAAEVIAGWRTDGFKYDVNASDKDRAAKRTELRTWLKDQFDKIQAGKKPDMKEPPPHKESKWEIDAP